MDFSYTSDLNIASAILCAKNKLERYSSKILLGEMAANISQDVLLYLAAGRFRELSRDVLCLSREPNPCRNILLRISSKAINPKVEAYLRVHVTSNQGSNFFATELRTLAEDDPRPNDFAICIIRHRYCSSFQDIWMCVQYVFNLDREQILCTVRNKIRQQKILVPRRRG
jgi:hypothetical protein